MVFRTSIAVLACVTAVQAATAAAAPVEHFARLPLLQQVEVSPGGKYFSAKVAHENRYRVAIFEPTNEGLKPVYSGTEDDNLWVRHFRWVAEDRLVVSVGFNGAREGTPVIETRLLGLSPGGALEPLFWYNNQLVVPIQIEDNVVSWIDSDPDHILVQYRAIQSTEYPSVHKVSVNKRARHKTSQSPRYKIYGWHADTQGVVRAGSGYSDVAQKQDKLIIRVNKKDKWRDISHRVEENAPDFVIRGFSERPNIAFVESAHEYDPAALYEYDIETDAFTKLILRDETSEISTVYLDSKTGELRGVGYGDEANRIKWFDEDLKKEIKAIREQFPGQRVSLLRESIDLQYAVYDISQPAEPARYHIYDRAEKNTSQLPALYPELENYALAEVINTSYPARDGLTIPAYVTLPAGARSLDEVKNAPFIVMPHGGPTARNFLRFDYWTQFLASRGYGVLQMNFRGSDGYGQAFRDAGDKEWGQAMQDDITDGAHWLIEQGYAAEDQLAILGGSYGGYAALMGAVKTPGLYQCAVSFAGVSDLPDFLTTSLKFIGGRGGTRHIGNLWRDGRRLRENSPARRAAAIDIPVLLVHGEDDRVVDIKQSRKMRNALKRAGKDVTFVELAKGDHHLGLYANRLRFLQETESFLGDCLN